MKTLYRSILDDDEKVLSKDKDMLDIFTILNTILKYIPNRKWGKIYYKARSVGAKSDSDYDYELSYEIELDVHQKHFDKIVKDLTALVRGNKLKSLHNIEVHEDKPKGIIRISSKEIQFTTAGNKANNCAYLYIHGDKEDLEFLRNYLDEK